MVHVLLVAALTAFVVWVIGEGLVFGDSGTLALTVFFVMSIAGAVLGGKKNRDRRPNTTPDISAEKDRRESSSAPAVRAATQSASVSAASPDHFAPALRVETEPSV